MAELKLSSANAGQFFWEASILMDKGELSGDPATILILSTAMMYAGVADEGPVDEVMRIMEREGVSRVDARDLHTYVDGWSTRAASKSAAAVYKDMALILYHAIEGAY